MVTDYEQLYGYLDATTNAPDVIILKRGIQKVGDRSLQMTLIEYLIIWIKAIHLVLHFLEEIHYFQIIEILYYIYANC